MTSTLLQSRTDGTTVSLRCWSASAHSPGDDGGFGVRKGACPGVARGGGGGIGADDTGDAWDKPSTWVDEGLVVQFCVIIRVSW